MPPERLVEPLSALEEDVPAELVRLGLWVAREYCSTAARGLALVLPPGTGTGARRVGARRRLVAGLTPAGLASAGQRLGPRQRAVLEALAGGSQPVAALPGDHSTLRRLEARGLVVVSSETTSTRPKVAPVGATAEPVRPTPQQRDALAEVEAALDGPHRAEPLLLHGVTGSGKTEVYLRAAAAALRRGRTAIVLVPEIALTPQTAARFAERFGDGVAILHSRLSARERYDEWARLRSGEARVCVGPRSAVFAPVERLGLIVVDEEHDASYKQEGDPRYDARHVAERRAADAGAVLLAGSATPAPGEPTPLPPAGALRAHRRPRAPAGRAGGGARARLASRAHARGAGRGRRARGEGHRPAQPARLVELPVVPRVRARVGVPRVRRDAGSPPGRARDPLPPLRPWRTVAVGLSRLRVRVRGAPRRGHGTARARARVARGAAARASPRRRHRHGRRGSGPAPLRQRAGRGAGRHPDGGQGPRLSRCHPRRGARRRRHAPVSRLPRGGAHVRPGGPAGRPERPRRARRPRDRAGARPGRPRAPVCGRPRRRGLSRGGARAPRGPRLSALRAPDPRGLLLRRGGAGAGRRQRGALRDRRSGGRRARPGAAVPAHGARAGAARGEDRRPRGRPRVGARGGGGRGRRPLAGPA